jgi:HSP20 family protein
MTGLMKRELFPFARPFSLVGGEWAPEDLIRVDEYHDDGVLVVRAEIPGIDPDKDVEVSVADRMLHIEARRHEEESREAKGYRRKEIRTGSFRRTLALPAGVEEGDVEATYEDGILEVRIPTPEPQPTKKIPVSKR